MSHLTRSQLDAVIETTQHNADVADAHYAGGYTLCIYLMKMRDYYRWRHDLDPSAPVDRTALGEWIPNMETRWDELEASDATYQPVPLPGRKFDCFDNDSINAALNPLGYVYAGIHGRGGMPHFFFARLVHQDAADNPESGVIQQSPLKMLIAGRELARSMTAPPAMSAPGLIFVRRDALRRYLGAMVEEWNWKREDNAMGKVISHYDFDADPTIALDRLLDAEQENVILHEIGERVAGSLIGDGWQSLLGRVDDPLTELKIRAVRDNLADCLASLPACVTLENWASLDFYYANMTPLRRELFPSFCDAYRRVRGNGDYRALAPVIARAKAHWLRVSRELPACKPAALKGYLDRCAF